MSAHPNVVPLPSLSERLSKLAADNRALQSVLKRTQAERDYWRSRAQQHDHEPPPAAA